MNDTVVTIIAIFLAAVLMFIFPLMTLADRSDDISEVAIQTATDDLVLKIAKTGKLTEDEYENFVSRISGSELYDIQMEFQILDENPAKKASQSAGTTKIGDNVYYSVYTTSILEEISRENGPKAYYLKEGDIVTVKVKNSSQTLAQVLRNIYYKVSGNDTYVIYGSSTLMVNVNGR